MERGPLCAVDLMRAGAASIMLAAAGPSRKVQMCVNSRPPNRVGKVACDHALCVNFTPWSSVKDERSKSSKASAAERASDDSASLNACSMRHADAQGRCIW
eukprot:GFKZ01015680.1.p3 GENE.GFKZ01015680.1~~GFKZ01015680.1.p3  ORF type:complete len:101 (+),score=2.70 GFKZ01015680.1:908-1210(+)